MLDVFQVRGQLAVPAQGVAATGLGQAGKARADGVALALLRGHKDHIPHQLRPRSDDAHIPFENIKGLRQLIQACGPQGPPKGCQPHIIGQQIPLLVPGIGHGAELIELENLLVLPGPGLGKEHRGTQLDPDQDSHDDIQPAEHGQRRQSAKDVQNTFYVPLVDAFSSIHSFPLTQNTPE